MYSLSKTARRVLSTYLAATIGAAVACGGSTQSTPGDTAGNAEGGRAGSPFTGGRAGQGVASGGVVIAAGGNVGSAVTGGYSGIAGAATGGTRALRGPAYFDLDCGSNGQMPAPDACASCQASSCSAELEASFGAAWRTGKAEGACASWFACIQECVCNDQTCYSGCLPRLEATPECETATSNLDTCVVTACSLACQASGGS